MGISGFTGILAKHVQAVRGPLLGSPHIRQQERQGWAPVGDLPHVSEVPLIPDERSTCAARDNDRGNGLFSARCRRVS